MYYLMTLNSAVNPFIYIAFNRELRRPLLRLFPFLTRCIIVVGYIRHDEGQSQGN